MLPWLSSGIFKHCAKRVSCFQYCLEFISYFLCKRALTRMSIPYLGLSRHQAGEGERGSKAPAFYPHISSLLEPSCVNGHGFAVLVSF